MNKDSLRIGIVGATGAVGVEILSVMERRNFPVKELRCFASERSVGRKLPFRKEEHTVQPLTAEGFEGLDFVFFSAGATRSREFVPAAVRAGAVVVDNSSAFRMMEEVPLVVPEVNREDIFKHKGVIANPNCSAAIMAVALWPLHQEAGIKKIIVSTYQAASGAGASAMYELEKQARAHVLNEPIEPKVFPHQIAFNLFSHNTKIASNGYNEEENKMVEETRKMFHLPNLPILPTCIRVPVLRAHSETIYIETEKALSEADARRVLSQAPGVLLQDDRLNNHFPMPIEATGKLEVLVGRIRQDLNNPHGLSLFVSGDQLLKGAAWNAVQIAEEIIKG